ncbi:DUF4097 family beta strand repeat-containing protein [Cytobacillus purgationiresistens]|uniref:DUF4097 and DUF4098 domain-containing protein YvlB n=1 Tax=Cytobacillus purgationiresistens TaxID=863449 RepID=A0ABU0AM47_9BACI|nr:DUF4097 family beta strand repeat-containing protein [Cytobacillus purgationiresistens]MDQ0272130.1 DUF4097 and DUF4098 domain-containing protein YvlB [Cytobacillus purgationiresistens]
MKQSRKPITIIAIGLVVIGILLAAIGSFAGAKFSIINTDNGLKAISKDDRKNEEISLKEFKNVKVDLYDADIEIIPSNEFKLKIERLEGTKITHAVENDTLIIKDDEHDSGLKFAMNFAVNIQNTSIKIYIPKDAKFLDVSIISKFGDIQLDGMATNKLNIHSNDGDVTINDIQSNELAVENGYGDITGTKVKTNELTIEMNDGDAVLSSIDAAKTVLKNQYGDISLHDFTSQEGKLESTDGDIEIDGELLGQTIIDSSFGDIYLALSNKESELSYNIQADFGDISVNGSPVESKAVKSANTGHKLDITSNDGDVEVTFKQSK